MGVDKIRRKLKVIILKVFNHFWCGTIFFLHKKQGLLVYKVLEMTISFLKTTQKLLFLFLQTFRKMFLSIWSTAYAITLFSS